MDILGWKVTNIEALLGVAALVLTAIIWCWRRGKKWWASRRTQLRAHYSKADKRLYAENIGEASATNVELELLLRENQEHLLPEDKPKPQLEEVLAGKSKNFEPLVMTDKDSRGKYEYVIRWQNPNHKQDEHKGKMEV